MKKIICLLLITSFILSNSMSVFALDNTNVSISLTEEFDLIEITTEVSLYLNNSTKRSTFSSILVIKNNNNYQEVQITEGTKRNILSYDKLNNQLYLDGNPIIITNIVQQSSGTSLLTLGSQFDHDYKQISFGKQLINLTVSALAIIITSACQITGSGGADLAQKIINAAGQSSYLYCYATYCHSYKRLDDSYYFYNKYWDMYWDSSYSNFCASYYQTIYQ